MPRDPESARLEEARTANTPWRKWGPYLSERQWGTVREDYSQDGNAWNYFTHDQSRSRAYHWGEDGIAGISDDHQLLCFSVALWNGKDPILKERMFGLTNSEGNHGEDVKEYYFYLDSTPTHSYMKYLYKYPQAAFPYVDLIEKNKHRTRNDLEYELLDTGIFNENRYFDVFIEYAKQFLEDLLIQISVSNRGSEPAAVAGMLWSKQFFFFDVDKWLVEHGHDPMKPGRRDMRNWEWYHMVNQHVISMPDKWEYPWYAAWDLAFHTMALTTVDVDFAEEQLDLMLKEYFLHPSGQIPAYEWNFSDVNPPVHAWASIFLYRTEQSLHGTGDLEFLKLSFTKLLLNFSWWVNRKDRFGNNLFQGGFLGMDNVGVFDRSAPLPTGGYLEQADGTAWVSLFSQNMFEIAIELAANDPLYEEMAIKFAEHFIWIAHAMNQIGSEGMWDEEDGFYYDILRLPDGSSRRLKVRSMVGLLPLCATTIIERWQSERVPGVTNILRERLKRMPELGNSVHPTGAGHLGYGDRGIAALVNPDRLRRILSRVVDEKEFLSPHGIRALSRYHDDHPYVVNVQGQEYRVNYLPAESDTGMFGGNSNWRGPIWMPVNVLLIRALLSFYLYYGDTFKIECPTGSGNLINLFEVARDIANRLTRIFLRDESGRRPVYGGTEKFQTDPQWKDYILFHEYFHADNGAGLGASHQTGWTGLVAKLIELFGRLDGAQYLEVGKSGTYISGKSGTP
jgi:hypothetical protein